MKILIAEDDLVSRSFLHKFLGKYGECDLVVDGLETIDAFLMALREKEPYDLICLDIMMPKVDGIKALQAIRNLENKYGFVEAKRVKIIMTTALSEPAFVKTAFDCGCEAYAAKPIDIQQFTQVLQKLGLIAPVAGENVDNVAQRMENNAEKSKNTPKQGMQKGNFSSTIEKAVAKTGAGYFKSVHALPDFQLEVTMETGTAIYFDFRTRLNTARFGRLRDEALFNSVRTDGDYLLFEQEGRMTVKITAAEFMDLVLIDRRK